MPPELCARFPQPRGQRVTPRTRGFRRLSGVPARRCVRNIWHFFQALRTLCVARGGRPSDERLLWVFLLPVSCPARMLFRYGKQSGGRCGKGRCVS